MLSWAAGRQALDQFVEQFEHACVGTQHMEGEFPLGRWVLKQRQANRQGRLPRTLVEELSAVRGWTWNVNESRWWETFASVRQVLTPVSGESIPTEVPKLTPRLSAWCSSQRHAYRAGKLKADRATALASLPAWRWRLREPVQERKQAETV